MLVPLRAVYHKIELEPRLKSPFFHKIFKRGCVDFNFASLFSLLLPQSIFKILPTENTVFNFHWIGDFETNGFGLDVDVLHTCIFLYCMLF